MNIIVIGGGGREHAIVKKLRENPQTETIYALPGNGGIAAEAVCVPIGATDIDAIEAFVRERQQAGEDERIGFAVVAQDDPLALGCVDRLEALGVSCFGPTANAAVIESSKVFAKDLMKRYGIPTARYEVFTDEKEALDYLKDAPVPTVVKADGLALGKGVVIAQTREEAAEAVHQMMGEHKFGASGDRIVIEEFLTGPEVTVLSFTDGKSLIPMVSSMDHKRIGDGDTGPNTGGMGVIAPNPYYTQEIADQCMREIFMPTVEAMNREGRTFKGCLYFGLMLTEQGPKVIEYNCRFGDPEAQVVLPLLKTDLLTVMQAVAEERLDSVNVEFEGGHACCVVMASGGYPVSYDKGYEITIDESVMKDVFIAGGELKDGRLVTSGGRVLGVTAVAGTLEQAISDAYGKVEKINFEKACYRRDIGARALQAYGA